VSVEDPSGPIGISVAGVGGTIPAGSGRRAVVLAVPAGATGDIAVTLTGAGVSFARPALQRGAVPSPFERQPAGVTLALCQRYFAKTFPPAVAPAQNAGLSAALVAHAIVANALPVLRWAYPVPMRAVPTLTFFNPTAANAQWSAGGVNAVASATLPPTSEAASIATAATPTLAPGALAAIHAVADGEL
jgi:hypothetical protein